MKKLLKIYIYISVLLLIPIVCIFISNHQPYAKTIYCNWSIKLPKPYKEIYYTDSGESFLGDGKRYSIFQYKREQDVIKSLDWKDDKNSSIEIAINEILSKLNVSVENIPNLQTTYKYYATTKKDSSKIYFIFFTDTKKLHVIEDIY